MTRKKLDRKKDYIQIVIDPDDKTAFDTWCLANSTTMSEIIRKEIAPYVAKGKKLLNYRDKQKQGMDTDSKLNDVAGFLKYQGAPKSLEDMEEAIGQGVEESGDGGSLC